MRRLATTRIIHLTSRGFQRVSSQSGKKQWNWTKCLKKSATVSAKSGWFRSKMISTPTT